MLAIRMQRTGRKGHAMFRVIVQDSQRTPTSGKVVFALGSYDPHTKAVILNKEKAAYYLEHGAQPSTRVARLLKNEGVKLPDWVKLPDNKERTVRNAEKRRSTAPAPEVEEAPAEETAAEVVEEAADEVVAEAIAEEIVEEEIAAVEEAQEEAVEAEAEKIVEEAATEEKSEAPAEDDKA